jgi:hypothetical protein
MKRDLIAIVSIVVVALLTLSLLLAWYNSPKEVTSAKIDSFTPNGYLNPGGTIWDAKFIIIVINNGTTDIENLTLTFNTSSPFRIERSIIITDSQDYMLLTLPIGQPYLLSTLKSGQNQTVYGYVEDNTEDSAKIGGYHFVATLKLGDTVLDQSRMIGDFIFYSTS